MSPSMAGCHGASCVPGFSPPCASHGAEGPETLSQCSVLDHRLPARTSAPPLSFSAPPADCRDNPRCFLCRSLPPQSPSWWWDKPCPCEPGTSPLLPEMPATNPVWVYGSAGWGAPSSPPLHPPSSFLSLCVCPTSLLPSIPIPSPCLWPGRRYLTLWFFADGRSLHIPDRRLLFAGSPQETAFHREPAPRCKKCF